MKRRSKRDCRSFVPRSRLFGFVLGRWSGVPSFSYDRPWTWCLHVRVGDDESAWPRFRCWCESFGALLGRLAFLTGAIIGTRDADSDGVCRMTKRRSNLSREVRVEEGSLKTLGSVPIQPMRDKDQAFVEIDFYGERCRAILLSRPNAIGVVCVARYEKEYERAASRCRPLNDAAKALLGGGDRFVTRDAGKVVAAAAKQEPAGVEGWTIGELKLLRTHIGAGIQEIEKRLGGMTKNDSRREHLMQERDRLVVASVFLRDWISSEHAKRHLDANADLRDPHVLLQHAARLLVHATKKYEIAWSKEDEDLIEVIRNAINRETATAQLTSREP